MTRPYLMLVVEDDGEPMVYPKPLDHEGAVQHLMAAAAHFIGEGWIVSVAVTDDLPTSVLATLGPHTIFVFVGQAGADDDRPSHTELEGFL